MMRKTKMQGGGFTLVELLVVMGIMGLLIFAAMPMFNGLTRSAGMKGATMQLRTTLSLARQWAITHRETTYVLFPTVDATNSAGLPTRAYRAYNVYTRSDKFIRDWVYLPEGLFFVSTGTDNVMADWSPSLANVVTNVPYPSAATPSTLRGFFFRPDGSTTGVGDIYRKPMVRIADGYTDDTTGLWVSKPDGRTNMLEVSSMAGQIKTYEQ